MKLRHFWKAVLMLTISALLITLLLLVGLFSYISLSLRLDTKQIISSSQISELLTETQGIYQFSGQKLLEENNLWAILIGLDGQVKWDYQKPDEVPKTYTLTDVASFTRWYLKDYPVQSHIREDGLLVVGSPKGSMWKHDISFTMDNLRLLPWWAVGTFLLTLGSVLGLSSLMMRRWFRQEQHTRDAARSDWINGISHDIRTPLSLVMGCASQLEEDPALDVIQHQRAAIIRSQSQTIRDLVNDLNLTMRLDCAMQPLRCEMIQPAVFLRQVVTDFLNSGLAEGYPVEFELSMQTFPNLKADAFLLRRAINNLLINCVRHNAPGCPIRVGGSVKGAWCILFVESGDPPENIDEIDNVTLAPDGGAAHGTGLKLVKQIASAHDGSAHFFTGRQFRCELYLPF